MVWQTHTLMITSDREKVWLEALIKEQDHAIDEAVRQVQERHLEEVKAIANTVQHWEDGWSSFKCRSASQEEDVKRSCEESPEYGATPRERGRSLHCKSKSDLQYPASPGRRCLGSWSFTPFRHWSHSRHHSHSQSSTPCQSCHRDSTPHTSRKRPVAKTPRPMEATPMQSPAQKTPKLKSLVQRVPITKNYRDPPYNCLNKDPKEFIWYLMGNLDRKAYDAEIRCLATFYSQATVLARHTITSIITTLVVANRGIHFLEPVIPRELMILPNNPTDAESLRAPAHSDDYQMDVRVHCVQEWTYLMHLLQYWYDAGSVYTYSSPVRQESKLMLFVFYQINAMLNPHSLYIHLHQVMDNTLWLSYYQARTHPEQCIADYESHLHVIKGLELIWNWLRNCYLVEATAEWRHLQLHGGSLDRLPFPHSYEDEWPGKEGPFYHSRGIHPNEIEPTPENAPQVANAMLEALAHHNCQQSEARDCQEYQQQQDNTESPMANFPSPTPIDQDEPTDLEGLEGTTAALQSSNPTTTVPPLSSSTTSAPAKKKVISIEEYNHRKATEWQLASAYLDRDKNREDLDYEELDPQDDPANIQISYRMPTPLPQIADLPPLQDATSSASPSAAMPVAPNVTIPMPQGSTSPGTVLGTTVHLVATAANWAPGFSRGLPVARASPMQVGTPLVSTSLMQVTTPAALPHGTPSHALTTEEELLWGATLPCSPQWEANLLSPLVVLTDNHIKMMDTLCHLDSYGLQFICELAEALHRERTPTQAPLGYHMLQASDIPCGLTSNPLLSQEFYRATSNLGTATVEPQQVPPQLHPAGNCFPDPEIESAITNMYRHKQASGMPPTDSNNNPQWGRGLSRPLSSHYTWTSCCLSSLSGSKNRRLETQGSRPLLSGYIIFTICYCNLSLLLGFLYLFTACVPFRKNHVNVFALCSRPYRYSWFISGLTALASCILSFQIAVRYNVRLKHLILSEHCITIAVFVCRVQFFSL